MNAFSPCELSGMREAAAASFLDACQLGAPSGGDWGNDPGARAYGWGAEMACGFQPSPGGEAGDGSQAPLADALLRLPLGTQVTGLDRVRITQRHGEALAEPDEYTIEGKPDQGVSALVLRLKIVAGTTAR